MDNVYLLHKEDNTSTFKIFKSFEGIEKFLKKRIFKVKINNICPGVWHVRKDTGQLLHVIIERQLF